MTPNDGHRPEFGQDFRSSCLVFFPLSILSVLLAWLVVPHHGIDPVLEDVAIAFFYTVFMLILLQVLRLISRRR